MKNNKRIVALQTTEVGSSQTFLSREISLTLEQGGYINLKFSGDNIAKVIGGVIRSVEGCGPSFDPEIPVNVTFRYWELDDELFDMSIEAGACDCMNGGETMIGCCRRLVAHAKMRFAAALARQQITLNGPSGQLEAV